MSKFFAEFGKMSVAINVDDDIEPETDKGRFLGKVAQDLAEIIEFGDKYGAIYFVWLHGELAQINPRAHIYMKQISL